MWYYEDFPFAPDDEWLEPYQGFVYQITEVDTGKKYIGKKFFGNPKSFLLLKQENAEKELVSSPTGRITMVRQNR